MDNFKEKIKDEAGRLQLTLEEKNAMRGALRAALYKAPIPSPYAQGWGYFSRVTVSALAIIVLVGGGTAYGAQGALPGDALYPVKINIVEPALGAFKITPTEQASWHVHLAEERLEEAETLAAQGKLTAPIAAQIQTNFDEHAAAATQIAQAVEQDNPQEDGTLSAKITAELAAQSAVLIAIASTTTNPEAGEITGLAIDVHARAHQAGLAERGEGHAVAASALSSPQPPETATEEPDADTAASSNTNRPHGSAAASVPEPQALPHVRAAAEAEIGAARNQFTQLQNDLSASTTAEVEIGLANADKDIAAGDRATSTAAALQLYTQALQAAVSLKTYLHADAQFPAAHLLPALLEKP